MYSGCLDVLTFEGRLAEVSCNVLLKSSLALGDTSPECANELTEDLFMDLSVSRIWDSDVTEAIAPIKVEKRVDL